MSRRADGGDDDALQRVGLSPTGVTSPWDFGIGVEEEYRVANARPCLALASISHGISACRPRQQRAPLARRLAARRQLACQSLGSVDDFFWQTMESLRVDDAYVQSIADAYLTADGRRGRLAQLHTAETPMVMVTHWQSLFSNGRRAGLRILNEVCRRVQGSLDEQVQWTHSSELARIIAAQDSPRQVVS